MAESQMGFFCRQKQTRPLFFIQHRHHFTIELCEFGVASFLFLLLQLLSVLLRKKFFAEDRLRFGRLDFMAMQVVEFVKHSRKKVLIGHLFGGRMLSFRDELLDPELRAGVEALGSNAFVAQRQEDLVFDLAIELSAKPTVDV